MDKLKGRKIKSTSLKIISKEYFQELGINPAYIPYGSVISTNNPYDALKKIHPNLDFLLTNKYGRDPWGGGTEFALAEGITEEEFEIFLHLDDSSISAEEKNEVLKKITLLKTVSSHNKIYYIIPGYLACDLDIHTYKIKYHLEAIISKYYIQHADQQNQKKEADGFLIGTTANPETILPQALYHLFPQLIFKTLVINSQYSKGERFNIVYIPDFVTIFLDLISKEIDKKSLNEKLLEEYIKYIFKEFYRQLKPESILILYINPNETDKYKIDNLQINIENLFVKLKIKNYIYPFYEIKKIYNCYNKTYLIKLQTIEPKITLEHVENKLENLGFSGTNSTLVADYKNFINYIIKVLDILDELINKKTSVHLIGPTPIQIDELQMICVDLKESQNRHFVVLSSLIKKIEQIKQIGKIISPELNESLSISFLENIDIYSLFGFSQEELEELYLIVTGHSTMTGIVRGKFPSKNLELITEKSFLLNKELSVRQIKLLELILEHKILLSSEENNYLENILNGKIEIDNIIQDEIIKKVSPYLPPLDILRLKKVFSTVKILNIDEKRVVKYIININNAPLSAKEKKILRKIIDEHKVPNNLEKKFLQKIVLKYSRLLENYFLPPEKVSNIIKRFYLMSIIEAAAGNDGEITSKQFDRFTKIRGEANTIIFNPDKTWNSILEEKVTLLGGTFWLSIRRMLRIFNILKVDQTLMKDIEQRIDTEIKIISKHDIRMIKEYKQTQELIRISKAFRDYYYIPTRFDQPFFFRRFLEKYEIHGSGRIFPKLTSESGFKLLWITVQASNNPCIDFNPLLPIYINKNSEIQHQTKEIEKSLSSISMKSLNFNFIKQIKEKLQSGEIVSIFASGLELKLFEPDETLLVSYVDVEQYLKKILRLVAKFENGFYNFNNIENLVELEFLYGELSKYPKFYKEEIERIKNSNENLDNINPLTELINKMEKPTKRIKRFFIKEIFDPEQIGTKIDIMSTYCPKILENVLHEFIELSRVRQIRKPEVATEYIKRMTRKFQSIVTKTRSEFQDRSAIDKITRQADDKTIINIEVSEKQLEKLEHFYESFKSSPELVKAITVAVVFSNTGKLPSMLYKYHKIIDFTSYPEAGANVLRLEKTLDNLVDDDTRNLSLHLIQHLGQIGRILRGDFPLRSIEDFLTIKDEGLQKTLEKVGMEKFLTAHILLCIIVTASVEEGSLTYDLLEKMFKFHEYGFEIINKKHTVEEIYEGIINEKGKKIDTLLSKISKDVFPYIINEKKYSISDLGEKAYVFERLFTMRGLLNVSYEDILKYFSLISKPINFDEHGLPILDKESEKKIKFIFCNESSQCVGINCFLEQMRNAIAICYEFLKLPWNTQNFFIVSLSGTKSQIKFWYVDRATKLLLAENQLKLIYLALIGMQYRQKNYSELPSSNYISFFGLSKKIDFRHLLLDKLLSNLSFNQINSNKFIFKTFNPYNKGGIYLKYNKISGTVKISFHDTTDINQLIKKMVKIQKINILDKFYIKNIEKFKKIQFNTLDYQTELQNIYVVYKNRLNNKLLLSWQNSMQEIKINYEINQEKIFHEYIKLYKKIINTYKQSLQNGKKSNLSIHGFTILKDSYEINIERIHNELQKRVLEIQTGFTSIKELEEFTNKSINFIYRNQSYFKDQLPWAIVNNYKKVILKFNKDILIDKAANGFIPT